MNTVDNLINALIERDTRQFPTGFTVEDRIRYAQTYVLNLLGDLVEEIPQIQEYLKSRTEIIQADIEDSEAWEPK